jgi:hypothetical protein
MVCGELEALVCRVTVPLYEPASAGVKLRLSAQLAPAARLAGQLLLAVKADWLLLSAPTVRAALPLLVSVTVWVAVSPESPSRSPRWWWTG